MYLMYVDESGDDGITNSPTDFFVLSGIVIHETDWQDTLNTLINFRRDMSTQYGLRIREEIHSSVMISNPGDLKRIKRHNRLAILRGYIKLIASIDNISIINIIVDKRNKTPQYDVFSMAWKALIQRFENTIIRENFPNRKHDQEKGMIFPDKTNSKKLTQLLRKMRYYNPIPNHPAYGVGYQHLNLVSIIDDPFYKESANSFFIQSADLVAYFLQQKHKPNSYIRRKYAHNYFDRLNPVLCTVASNTDPQGIVRL